MKTNKKRTKKNVVHTKDRRIIGIALLVACAVFVGLMAYANNRSLLKSYFGARSGHAIQLRGAELERFVSKIDRIHPSRTWMNFMMSDIRDNEKNPPEAARAYAYVATIFDEVRTATGNDEQAHRATRALLIQMYPYLSVDANKLLNMIQGGADVTLTKDSVRILQIYVDRWNSEPHKHEHLDIPNDPTLWKPRSESGAVVEPIATEAVNFKRWIVQQDFHLDSPPVVGSDADAQEIAMIKKAIQQAPAWKDRIEKWALAKGTGTPGWIWQDMLYEYGKNLDDKTYGRLQKELAQSVADAFIICWQKKYTFWTARPFMRIQGFSPSIETPFFPGYPSGHATVSAASATVLGHMFPSHKKELLNMAEEAKNTRLYSGIHFNIDNENGFELGERIGTAQIEALRLESVE